MRTVVHDAIVGAVGGILVSVAAVITYVLGLLFLSWMAGIHGPVAAMFIVFGFIGAIIGAIGYARWDGSP